MQEPVPSIFPTEAAAAFVYARQNVWSGSRGKSARVELGGWKIREGRQCWVVGGMGWVLPVKQNEFELIDWLQKLQQPYRRGEGKRKSGREIGIRRRSESVGNRFEKQIKLTAGFLSQRRQIKVGGRTGKFGKIYRRRGEVRTSISMHFREAKKNREVGDKRSPTLAVIIRCNNCLCPKCELAHR